MFQGIYSAERQDCLCSRVFILRSDRTVCVPGYLFCGMTGLFVFQGIYSGEWSDCLCSRVFILRSDLTVFVPGYLFCGVT